MPRTARSTIASSTLTHVHITKEGVHSEELTPPHPPRKETPIYRMTHKRLVITEDRPCFICGVRRSDLLDPARKNDKNINPYGATAIETHHWPIERSLADGCDPELVAQAYPSVRQYKTFIEWVDSENNMLVLCSACHRTADHAIHHALYQDAIATKFAIRDKEGDRYAFVATDQDVAQVEQADEVIEDEPPPAA